MYLIFQLLSTTTTLYLGQEQTRPHRPTLGGLGVGDEEKRLEGDLILGDEVGLGHGAVLVLDDGFVELVILILLTFWREDLFLDQAKEGWIFCSVNHVFPDLTLPRPQKRL